MSQNKISRYPVPSLEELPEDIKVLALGVKEKFGFIPNVLLALAHRPAELRAFLAYHNALVEKTSGLSRAEIEMLIVAHSSYNGCIYCVLSHGAALRMASQNPYLVEQIAINYHEADINERKKAIIDFAMKITTNSKEISEEDFETLKSHGLSDEDIWDIAGIASFYNMSNRMMSFLSVRTDEPFFTMGR